jgi:septum formation protein
LRQIGVRHLIVPADIDETLRAGEAAEDYVMRMAHAKALCLWEDPQRRQGLPVLAADTAVVVDGRVLGKPSDAADARSMLRSLSSRTHVVLSAVAVQGEPAPGLRLSRSTVRLRALTEQEIQAYIASGEPADKAGAYAIQGLGAIFVESISGSYSGVMGLPLFETAQLLVSAGIQMLGAQRR